MCVPELSRGLLNDCGDFCGIGLRKCCVLWSSTCFDSQKHSDIGQEWEPKTCLTTCGLELIHRRVAGELQSCLFPHAKGHGPREVQKAHWNEQPSAVVRFDVLTTARFRDPHVVQLEKRFHDHITLLQDAMEKGTSRLRG